MSESSEEKIGLILGKLEGLHEYTREMNHGFRDELGRTTLLIEDLREHVDEKDKKMDERVRNLERESSNFKTIVKTLKVSAVALFAAVGYNWRQFMKIFGGS